MVHAALVSSNLAPSMSRHKEGVYSASGSVDQLAEAFAAKPGDAGVEGRGEHLTGGGLEAGERDGESARLVGAEVGLPIVWGQVVLEEPEEPLGDVVGVCQERLP